MIVSRKLLLPSLLIVFIGVTLVHPHISIGQTNTNFLTYTNPELGFIIEYPSDWKIAERIPPYNDTVFIMSPDHTFLEDPLGFTVGISVDQSIHQSMAELEGGLMNYIDNHTDPGVTVVEVNNDSYYLGGHPALRYIILITPPNFQTYDHKAVHYETLIDGKEYSVEGSTNATLFPEYETTFQHMVESFRAIKLQ